MHYIMHIKFTYWHKLNMYNIYNKSYTKTHLKLASRRKEAFRALALPRLLVGLLLLFSIDITSQCDVVHLHPQEFFLDRSQFVF
jgi:hypothetical protein